MRSLSRTLFLGGMALCAAACAGDGPEPVDSSSWFARLQSGVFDQSCTTAGCHNPQAAAAGLILTAPFSFDALVGVTPTTPAAVQAGLLLVSPFEPEGSFLLTKVLNPGPGQGSRMPQGAEPLSAAQIETIREWIEAGAPRFDTTPDTEPTATATATDLPATPTATSVPPTPMATALPTTTPSEPTESPVPGTPSATATAAADTPTPTEAPPTATPSEPTPVPTVSLAQVQAEIFSPSCAVQFCHGGPFPAAQLDLEDGRSYDELVNVVPLTVAAANAGMLLVDPGNAENSFLYIKITNPTAEQGFLMPLTGSRLNEQQVALVRAWIESL